MSFVRHCRQFFAPDGFFRLRGACITLTHCLSCGMHNPLPPSLVASPSTCTRTLLPSALSPLLVDFLSYFSAHPSKWSHVITLVDTALWTLLVAFKILVSLCTPEVR